MPRLLIAVAAVAFAACSSSSRPPTAPPAEATATRAPSLLDHVPADTPFLLSSTGSSFAGAQLHDMLAELRAELAPVLEMTSDDMLASLEPNERILFVAMRAVASLDAADLGRLGLDPSRVELAAYGWGLTPVMRLRLDGRFLRDLVARAMKDAGLDAPALRWGKHEYRTWTFDSGLQLVAVVLDDQLAMAFSRRAEKVLPHLVGDAAGRPARGFELATIRARYPQLEGEPVLFIDPARAAALVERGDELRALLPEPPPACPRALASLVRSFPPIAATTTEPNRKTRETRFVIGPSPALAKTLATLARPIPRWPGDDARAGLAIYGVGLAPLATLEALAGYVDGAFGTAAACGVTPPPTTMREAIRSLAPVLAPVNGATFVIHEIAETEEMPLQVELVADVTDPYAIYSWMSAQLGLPPRPPALGSPTPVSLGFLPSTIVLEAHTFAATLGRHDPTALAALRHAPAGPRELVRVAMGAGTTDNNPDGATLLHATLEGDTIVMDMVERAP